MAVTEAGRVRRRARRPRWRGRVLVAAAAAVLVVAALLVGVQLFRVPTDGLPRSPLMTIPATGEVVRIAPDGTGDGRSASWADAAPLEDLPQILANATPGTQVWLLAERGPYAVTTALQVRGGGSQEEPVVVRGVDEGGNPRPAEFVGTRVDPFNPAGDPGREVFRLLGGADHLIFQDLAFRNVGNGAFRIAADITDLMIRRTETTNVRRFIENTASGEAGGATVTGLTVADVTVSGYSRGLVRLRYDSNHILFEGVTGDSQRQDGDPFSIGVHLAGTVHDVDIRNTAMTNSVSTEGEYWNGDGFATEKDTYDIRFAHTYSAGHTDGGYDLKSRSATLVDAVASDSKRNFRFHGTITVDGCRATDPRLRGGTGTQAQIQATSEAVVDMRNCTITDDDPRTIVFDVDGTARLTVADTVVERSPAARTETVEPEAELRTADVEVDVG